jgi:enterochelin esterase family protein
MVQRDGARYMNAVLVEGDYADNYKESDKPGNLEQVWYHSAENDMTRRLYVYTPHGYNPKNTKVKYPVLYLLHGGGGDEDAWSTLGRTCQILDNLIAAGKAEPMLVVMPNGNPSQYASQTLGIPEKTDIKKYSSNFDNYSSLVADIVPFIESRYNVIAKKSGRAIAGLSMGGGQSWSIGLKHPEVFANIGIFSSGMFGGVTYKPFDLATELPELLADPQAFNDNLDLFYISCGETDPRITHTKTAVEAMREKGAEIHFSAFPGGHEWQPWRKSLHEMVQMLFK